MKTGADPPASLWRTLGHLGPGMVLAGSIVGSGELIATTRVGAEAGFVLLWLLVLGCLIKVAAQVEIGRATLTRGRTPLAAFDSVPGPRLAGRGWIWWGWAFMTALIVVQQGGILAGVAQTLAAGLPLTRAGVEWNRGHDAAAAARLAEAAARRGGAPGRADELQRRCADLDGEAASLPASADATLWTVVTAVVTAILLAVGRYGLVERLSILLVGTFTLVTCAARVLLQRDPAWAISGAELASGLVPRLPAASAAGRSPLTTALATLGIIGVGASELMFYPYWCLETRYGRAVGARDASAAWAARARGWIRVLRIDALVSAAVYTTVTAAFYLLGSATLGRVGLRPAGDEMVRVLGAMYEPAFGPWAPTVFLGGAFAVLFSTLLAAADGNARLIADGLALAGIAPADEASRGRWIRGIAVAWVLAALVAALTIREPVGMVLASGAAQAVMLAAIAVAVLVFRHRDLDPRLAPSRAWDGLLWASCAALVVVAAWTLWQRLLDALAAAR
ncbi:MAG: Nramp family divalent metal transporter [Planctomycetaceae bacterium]